MPRDGRKDEDAAGAEEAAEAAEAAAGAVATLEKYSSNPAGFKIAYTSKLGTSSLGIMFI